MEIPDFSGHKFPFSKTHKHANPYYSLASSVEFAPQQFHQHEVRVAIYNVLAYFLYFLIWVLRAFSGLDYPFTYYPISFQYFNSLAPENLRKTLVF